MRTERFPASDEETIYEKALCLRQVGKAPALQTGML
jgi:hypothetical protein